MMKPVWLTPKRLELMTRLQLETPNDIIHYFPRRYVDLTPMTIAEENHLQRVVIRGEVVHKSALIRLPGHLTKFTVEIRYQDNIYKGIVFNRQFIHGAIHQEREITISGKLNFWKSEIMVADILIQLPAEGEWIRPVYSLPEEFKQNEFRSLVNRVLPIELPRIKDILPGVLAHKYQFPPRGEALKELHQPTSQVRLKQAVNYFKYEEFLLYSYAMAEQRLAQQANRKVKRTPISLSQMNEIISHLPFTLTNDQLQSFKEIHTDLHSPNMMYRLLQGDVGTGKTLVAFLGLMVNYMMGLQGAFMAPTEILARQHFKTLVKWVKSFPNLKVGLLVSSMPTAEKTEVRRQISSGEVHLIVGTHALVQESVEFYSLGLAVIDEQHRFGVTQRQILRQKGEEVDLLMMSATPIPRTLAMTLYGDMGISTLTQFPNKKRSITTKIIEQNSIKPLLGDVEKLIGQGGQMFVICPLIEDTGTDRKNAKDVYESLLKYYRGRYHIGLIHGRLEDEEKNKIMAEFETGSMQILVATTVVEVGVDIKQANAMVIYNAERFGLSQLHQLRGRIGRNGQEGFCFLLTDEKDPVILDRLHYIEKQEDGFELARYDLEHRGPGDLLGVRQSGLPDFSFGNLVTDIEWLDRAQKDAVELIRDSSQLKETNFIEEVNFYRAKKMAVIA